MQDHWHKPETDQPEKEPGQFAQDKSVKPPARNAGSKYEKTGVNGEQAGETFKK